MHAPDDTTYLHMKGQKDKPDLPTLNPSTVQPLPTFSYALYLNKPKEERCKLASSEANSTCQTRCIA